MRKVFINGHYVDSDNAKISVFDRGFLFGDAVYEVLPVYKGSPWFVDQHLARLHSNLEKVKIEMPHYDWHELINKLIHLNSDHSSDLQVYIHVSRGNQKLRKHEIPVALTPSVIMFTIHNDYPTTYEKEKGLSAKLVEDTRWARCDIKTTSLLANILLNDEAIADGYDISILVRDNVITEASTANVFMVSDKGVIKTPPLTHHCLPGVTRQLAVELIKKLNWQFEETEISTQELLNAQELWITSTTKEIMPIIKLDNKLINSGHIGDFWRIINKQYHQLIS